MQIIGKTSTLVPEQNSDYAHVITRIIQETHANYISKNTLYLFLTQSSVIIASPAAETAAKTANAGQTGPAPAPVSPRAPGAAAALDAAECEGRYHQDHGNHNENNLICFQDHSQQFTDTRDRSVFAFCMLFATAPLVDKE